MKTFMDLASEANRLSYPSGVWTIPLAGHVICVNGDTEEAVRRGADVLKKFLRKNAEGRSVVQFRYSGKYIRRDASGWFAEVALVGGAT